jgi:kynurenine formamidase
MTMIRWIALVAWASVACTAAPPADEGFPAGEIVDLSHTYDAATIFWPTSDTFRPDRLVGPAVVIDVTDRVEGEVDYLVSVADLQAAEQRDGPLPAGAIVLIRTGFSGRWPDALRYLGTAERGAEAATRLHFPGLHPDAAAWLVDNRDPGAVGIDTASIDHGPSTEFQAHRRLAAANVPAFENLTSLERLPPRGATVVALPMKIGGGSGAPLRAIAILPRPPAP